MIEDFFKRRPIVCDIAVCLALCALSGCAPQVLRFPPDQSAAKLRYVTTALPSDQTYLLRVDTQSCPAAPGTQLLAYTGDGPNSGLEVSTVAMIDGSGKPEALVRELYIPADAPFVFLLRANRELKYDCDNAGVFQPLPGREYELRYVIAPATFVCIVQINELRLDSVSHRRPETSANFFYAPRQSTDYCKQTVRKEHE